MTTMALAPDEGIPARYIGQNTAYLPFGQYGIAMECENPQDVDFQPLGYDKIYRLNSADVELLLPDSARLDAA